MLIEDKELALGLDEQTALGLIVERPFQPDVEVSPIALVGHRECVDYRRSCSWRLLRRPAGRTLPPPTGRLLMRRISTRLRRLLCEGKGANQIRRPEIPILVGHPGRPFAQRSQPTFHV